MEYDKIIIKNKEYFLVPVEQKFTTIKYKIINNEDVKNKLKEYIDELKASKLTRHKFTAFQKAFNEKYKLNLNSNNLAVLLDNLGVEKIKPKNIRTLLL